MARRNEYYPDGPMTAPGAISMTKVKNLLKKGVYAIENAHNTRVNGQLRGCFGFVRRTDGNRYVYFDTEGSSYGPLADKILVRYAASAKDYTGERNIFIDWADFGKVIDEMLGA